MNVIAVDPNPGELEALGKLLTGRYAGGTVTCFSDPLMAVKYGANHPVDALYTVTAMNRLNGFELSRLLRELRPGIKLHFIATDDREKRDVMRILGDSVIKRPVTEESIRLAEEADW